MNSEIIFTVIASIEKKTFGTFFDVAAHSNEISRLENELKNQLLSSSEVKMFATVAFTLGVCGSIIQAEIESKKGTKKLSSSMYGLVDRVADQIALKAQLSNIYHSVAVDKKRISDSSSSKARACGLIMGVKALLVKMTELDSLTSQLGGFGAFSANVQKILNSQVDSLAMQNSISDHLMNLAA